MTRRLLLAVTLALAMPALAAPARTLNVAAAANLKQAADEIAKAFEAEHPDTHVALTFGASGNFFAQIKEGAPFDVFLSADRDYPVKLVEAKLGSDERVYGFGKLVAWLPAGSSVDLEKRGLAALADPAVKRIAIANPAVAPFGRATEAALKAAGVYDQVKDRFVLGTSVGQTAQFATTGSVDVAFLPYSLTFSKELQGGRVVFVKEGLYPRIEQSGVVIAASKEQELARAFLAFLAGEKARSILTKYGYGLP